MSRRAILCYTVATIGILPLTGVAAEIHKWVDANGITHYSDEPPLAAETPVTQIEVSAGPGSSKSDDYFSIANQWARMHRERLERDRIRLEQARLQAAQRAQEARTEVVYVEKPAATRYVSVYKLKRHRRYGKTYRHRKPARSIGYQKHRHRPQNHDATSAYYKPLP